MHRRGHRAHTRRPTLPDGLYYCRFCGEVAGQLDSHKSTCLCEGISCRYCGIGRVRRPIRDNYEPATGTFWHSPYFMGMSGCRDCKVTVYGRVPRGWHSWPGPLADDPALRDLLDTIKQAGLALSSDRAQPLPKGLERLPSGAGLYAVHGDARAWSELGLEKAPDERPLYVGQAGAGLPRDLRGRSGLRLASWAGREHDLKRVGRELRHRWEPPLPGEEVR